MRALGSVKPVIARTDNGVTTSACAQGWREQRHTRCGGPTQIDLRTSPSFNCAIVHCISLSAGFRSGCSARFRSFRDAFNAQQLTNRDQLWPAAAVLYVCAPAHTASHSAQWQEMLQYAHRHTHMRTTAIRSYESAERSMRCSVGARA